MYLAFFHVKTNGAIVQYPIEEIEKRVTEKLMKNHALIIFHTKRSLIKAFRKALTQVIEDVKQESINIP